MPKASSGARISRKSVGATIGFTLKEMRTVANLTQTDLAKVLAVHQAALSRIENGSQSLQAWQIQRVADYFQVRVDSLFSGKVNYWKIAQRFGTAKVLPERYREHPLARIREVVPLLNFAHEQRGRDYVNEMVSGRLGLDSLLFQSPGEPIGIQCTLDVARVLLREKVLKHGKIAELTEYTRGESAHDFLHETYLQQESALALIKVLLLNAHHYNSGFQYRIEDKGKDALAVSIAPAECMKEAAYKDPLLQDFVCQYRKAYLASFPAYIGSRSLHVTEPACQFRGARECTYTIKAA